MVMVVTDSRSQMMVRVNGGDGTGGGVVMDVSNVPR